MPNETPMKVVDVDPFGVVLRWGRGKSLKTIPWRDLFDCKWSEDKQTWRAFEI